MAKSKKQKSRRQRTGSKGPKARKAPSSRSANAKNGPNRFQKIAVLSSVIVIVVMLTIAGAVKACSTGWQYIMSRDEFKIRLSNVGLPLPKWARAELEEDIKCMASLQRDVGIFEKNVAKRIAEAFEESPWIERVNYVKKEFPNRVKIEFKLRKPAAIVRKITRAGARDYIVDRDGVRLPKRFYDLPSQDMVFPYIISNYPSSIPKPGEKWEDEGIKSGIVLISLLKRTKHLDTQLRIYAVDITNSEGRKNPKESYINLLTRDGTKIKWGRSPLYKTPSEVSLEAKLKYLLTLTRLNPVAISGADYIDVRWDKLYIKHRGGTRVSYLD